MVAEETTMEKSKMHPVPIDELILNPKNFVDIFVQLSDAKFVLVAKAGTNTAVDQLEKFKGKGVMYLYVKPEDYHTVVNQSVTMAGLAVGSKAVSNLSKLSVIEEALGSVFREVRDIGVHDQVVLHAKLVVEAAMTVLAGNPGLSLLVERFSTLTNSQAKHSMLVSMVAAMLGQGHSWVKQSTLEKLALGGMLHDIGMFKLPPELATKDPSRMTHDETVLFKGHPEIGRQMLASVKGMPDDVLLCVYEHHEYSDGSGFPRGVKDFMISPLARVVSVANGFVHLVLDSGKTLTTSTARKAIEEIETGKAILYNKDSVRALKRLIEGDHTFKKVG